MREPRKTPQPAVVVVSGDIGDEDSGDEKRDPGARYDEVAGEKIASNSDGEKTGDVKS